VWIFAIGPFCLISVSNSDIMPEENGKSLKAMPSRIHGEIFFQAFCMNGLQMFPCFGKFQPI